MSTTCSTSSCTPSVVRNATAFDPDPQRTVRCPAAAQLRSWLSHAARLRAAAAAKLPDKRMSAATPSASPGVKSDPCSSGLVTIIKYWPSYPVQILCTAKPVPVNRCLSDVALKYEQCS